MTINEHQHVETEHYRCDVCLESVDGDILGGLQVALCLDMVPRKKLRYCMGKSEVSKNYVRQLQDINKTVVRCVVGVTDGFKAGVELHQGSV